MGKYENLQTNIFSVFNSSQWKSENIKTFPVNYIQLNAGNEFIKVSIIPSGKGINAHSVSGILIIDIFIPAGNGPKRASLIADKLDHYLVGKSFSTQDGNTQFIQNSSLDFKGLDKDNETLFRSSYTIPFTFFGVI